MRFQLALNVRDLDEAIPYYEKLLGAELNKRKPGYANFAVENPPIKLVLFERPDATERLDHVGFEMSGSEVEDSIERIVPTGIPHDIARDEVCCYAEKSTIYSRDPEGLLWEFYEFRGDAEQREPSQRDASSEEDSGACCPDSSKAAGASCC